MNLSDTFWDNRYQSNDIGWDIGYISTPLKEYFDQLTDKNARILIPGGGNSYEAEYLHQKGFDNIFVVDFSKTALSNLKERVPDFPSDHLIQNDFFKLEGSYDLIVEQTFFSALNPTLRSNYAKKMNELLSEKGKLIGLLFDAPLYKDHPPFGGNKKEYTKYFESLFNFVVFDSCYNSIDSRMNRELFIILVKK